jgi:TetR/AcrR family tetracycline transcriptional repressor
MTEHRPALSRESIFRAALDLVDTDGIDALTMRRLATRLEVGTMSLYSHVLGKEELLDGVVATVAGEIGVAGPDQDWRQAARFMVTEFRRVARRHPNVVPLLINRPPASTEGMNLIEAGFEYLRRAGVDEKKMAQAYRLVISYAIGFVSLETAGFFSSSGPAAMSRARDPVAFPRVTEVAPYLVEWDPDEEFDAGLDVLLDVISGYTSHD